MLIWVKSAGQGWTTFEDEAGLLEERQRPLPVSGTSNIHRLRLP
ncbi:hypothetical protein [Halomonas daqiaonensis]|nr:hypothetical protein [Halomonas daqiaonensis]